MTDQPLPQHEYVPSSPSPEITALVFSILRALISALAGWGIYRGSLPGDNELWTAAGALTVIGMGSWGVITAIRNKRRDHAGSVQSAITGQPLQARS